MGLQHSSVGVGHRSTFRRIAACAVGLGLSGGSCGFEVRADDPSDAAQTDTNDPTGEQDDSGTEAGSGDEPSPPLTGDDSTSTGALPKLDVAPVDGTTSGITSECAPSSSELDAPADCDIEAPSDIFDPVVAWSWTGENGEDFIITTPLVGNVTDDNNDGATDLCDDVDVVIIAVGETADKPLAANDGHLYIIDGSSGETVLRFETPLSGSVSPAFGDLDGDRNVEIVAGGSTPGSVVAFSGEGDIVWATSLEEGARLSTLSIADIDHDGFGEVIGDNFVLEADGTVRFTATTSQGSPSATAANLDGNPGLELLFGDQVFHADGALYRSLDAIPDVFAFPHVADIDDDPMPEIIVTSDAGVTIYEHDGTLKSTSLFAGPPAPFKYSRPAAIHDIDGDGTSELVVGIADQFTLVEFGLNGAESAWGTTVLDEPGAAGATAFDFNADGFAESVFADSTQLFIFDDLGGALLASDRQSSTYIEYPVVADIDADGHAEILVVSNGCDGTGTTDCVAEPAPPLQAIADAEDRWLSTRRIWNQHSYHVTNVREDGTIPEVEPNSWETYNTFRTNANTAPDGTGCIPPQPEG